LSVIREKAVGTLGEEAAQVFDAHLMVLADPEMMLSLQSQKQWKKKDWHKGNDRNA
ncbi:phosphoenolpyruvate-protein phosphotransferase, partial [Shigella flexneri]